MDNRNQSGFAWNRDLGTAPKFSAWESVRLTSGLISDAAGNMTQATAFDGSKTLCVYDDAHRLLRIEKRDVNNAPLSKSEFIYNYASRKAVSQEFTFMKRVK